jgi:membrane-bound serine protease (ClpP class)
MFKQAGVFLLLFLAGTARAAGGATAGASGSGKPVVVYVIPVQAEINTPTLYIVRRGLKEAIEQKADAVLLDMNTPGGSGGAMLEIMEALDKYPGEKLTYVNREAISAGAIIAAVTDEIYFSPKGIMGSADVIQSTGEDLPEALKRKLDSYLSAKIEVYTKKDARRASVIKAMRLPDYELKLDDKVIKSKGELLTVTAEKAIALYGEPPTPLLASGIASDLDALLAAKYGRRVVEKVNLKVTWSEELAHYINLVSPVLLGLGLLALFIEFKTPGFGVFGITGIILLGIVFLGNYVAGFSGHEPLLAFALGLILVAVELLFFPGVAIVAVAGLVLMLGSLVWAMADLWPGEPFSVAWSGNAFVGPMQTVGLGLLLALVLAVCLWNFLPKGWFFSRLAVGQPIAGAAQVAGVAPELGAQGERLIGRAGLAVTGLFPSGQIEIDGRRYEARVEVGTVTAGSTVVVRRKTDFNLIVVPAEGTQS